MEVTSEQITKARLFKTHYPYRIVYLLTKKDQWEVICPKDRRPVNKMIRDGWQAYKIK